MDSQESKGLLYVATKKESFLAEAVISAKSVKETYGPIPIRLYTNLVESPLLRDSAFDEILPIPTVTDYTSQWAQGQLDRIQCLNQTPYDFTLHLDTDTKIRRPEFQHVFEYLRDHDIAMVECADDASISRHHYGRPMFNVGFILYRKNEKTRRLFTEWEKLTKKHFEIASTDPMTPLPYMSHITDPALRRNLLFMDQLSFVQLLSPEVNPFDLRLKILEEKWNFRGASVPRVAEHEIIVDHRPLLKQTGSKNSSLDSRPVNAQPPISLDQRITDVENLINASHFDEARQHLHILLHGEIQTTSQLMRLGICCHRTKLNQAAADLLLKYVNYHPDNVTAYTNLSIVLRHLDRFEESILYANRALQLQPDHRMGYICLITTYCKMEQPRDALNVCNQFLFRKPHDIGMMALKLVALSKLGLMSEAQYLQDYEKLVRPFDCFESNDDRLEFNAALAHVIQNHPSLKNSPDYHATRNGLHSGNLSRNDGPEISRLMDLIDVNVNDYISRCYIPGHPFFEPKPDRWNIRYFWSVVMQNAGHQTPHSHPTGWLSGVYYCKIPETFGKDLSDPHGWIEFGRPDEDHYGPCKEMDVRLAKPEVGQMILFPSYYWHSTVPLKSEDVRISFAFDIIRA
jgi:uncharacterized protein (TIGR02466 family)